MRIVVGFESDGVQVSKSIEEVRRDMAEVGRIADAITKPLDYETVRSKLVMGEIDRVTRKATER